MGPGYTDPAVGLRNAVVYTAIDLMEEHDHEDIYTAVPCILHVSGDVPSLCHPPSERMPPQRRAITLNHDPPQTIFVLEIELLALLSLVRAPLHECDRDDGVCLLPAHRLSAYRTVPDPLVVVPLPDNQSLRQALVAVHVAAAGDSGVGEGLHADDAGAPADLLWALGSCLLTRKELLLLGLKQLFFGTGGFVGEV